MRLVLVFVAACTASVDAPVDDGADTDLVWEELPMGGDEADPVTDRLCAESADPTRVTETTQLDCLVEGGHHAPANATAPDSLLVMTWNLERGLRYDEQAAALLDGTLPRPDILLLSEVDRGCPRTGRRHIARELATALGMDWVYGVEFVELPSGTTPDALATQCEHGNAVLASFPLGNATHSFHRSNDSWYAPPADWGTADEPRLGGRSLVGADAQIGSQRVRLFALHFESRVQVIDIQVDQAVETAELAAESPYAVLVGGDTNSPGYTFDVEDGDAARGDADDRTVAALLAADLVDAHAPLTYPTRATRKGLVLDLLLGRGVTFTEPGVCDPAVCDPLSDHQAVWATTALNP